VCRSKGLADFFMMAYFCFFENENFRAGEKVPKIMENFRSPMSLLQNPWLAPGHGAKPPTSGAASGVRCRTWRHRACSRLTQQKFGFHGKAVAQGHNQRWWLLGVSPAAELLPKQVGVRTGSV
jgi:hypothetical protein